MTPEKEGPSDEGAVEDGTPAVEPTVTETTEPTATSTPANPTATPGDEGDDSAGGD